jgi:hypothetical protein
MVVVGAVQVQKSRWSRSLSFCIRIRVCKAIYSFKSAIYVFTLPINTCKYTKLYDIGADCSFEICGGASAISECDFIRDLET